MQTRMEFPVHYNKMYVSDSDKSLYIQQKATSANITILHICTTQLLLS